MMRAAERDGEFVADLLCQPARLRKAQVVRVGWFAAADEAGLFGHKPQMLFVPQAFGLGQGQDAFVDAGAGFVVRRWLAGSVGGRSSCGIVCRRPSRA